MNFTNSTNTTPSLADDYKNSGGVELSVSDEVLEIIQIINHVILSGAVCLLGMIINIINMIIFVQQGLDNTVNISMFAIALSDWCSLVTLEWANINLNPFMEKADVPFEPADIQYLIGGWPHACFLQITIWITVYVTAERFVCIAFPLRVKQIVTPFRTKVVITCIYLFMFAAVAPMYVIYYYGDNFYPSRNETRVGIRVRDVDANLEDIVYMMSAVIGLVSFITLTILTCLLVVTLKSRSDWRKKSTMDGEKSKKISARDSKSMTMVSLIAGILIICSAPGMIFSVVVYAEPEFIIYGKFGHIVHISFSFSFLSEAINSTVNIFFFYKMSTKFRLQFQQLFVKCPFFQNNDSSFKRPQSSASRGVSTVNDGINNVDGDSQKPSSTLPTSVQASTPVVNSVID